MKNLFQRNLHTVVSRSDDTKLVKAKTTYIDTYRGAVANLVVDVNSFIIKEAFWEEMRSSENINLSTKRVTPLIGSEAYHSSGSALKEAAVFLQDPLAVSLFSETIKGMIQAQNFLLEERGYASLEEYTDQRIKELVGTCRYFSNLDRVNKRWYDDVVDSKRVDTVFARFKTQSLFGLGDDQYLLLGNLSDPLHEVNARIKLDQFTVLEADGVLLRAPDMVCKEAAGLLNNLRGVNIQGLTKKEVASILGKGQGCVHLIDLANDCVQILEIYKF